MSIKLADLHTHSYYSDGTMSPEEILKEAYNRGVDLIAITDHDMLDGSLELMKINDKYDIKCISGVEIDTLYKGVNFHILGYGIDLKDKKFCSFIKQNRILLEEVNIKLIEKLEKDCENISLSEYLNYTHDRKKGGWKTLHYLLEKGVTENLLDGFAVYSKYNHTHNCVEFPAIEEACKHIHNAGGKAVLAHPGKVINTTDLASFKSEVLKVVDLGIDGIECYYPSHTKAITEACLEICESRNLLITCGSDCHGEFQATAIGEMDIPIEKLRLGNLFSFNNTDF
jgi:predicted metal-dependent phosphoesterase TrpH